MVTKALKEDLLSFADQAERVTSDLAELRKKIESRPGRKPSSGKFAVVRAEADTVPAMPAVPTPVPPPPISPRPRLPYPDAGRYVFVDEEARKK